MRRPLPLRRSLAALALPLLLGGLAACSSDPEGAADPASSSSEADDSATETEAGGEVDKAEFVDDLKAGLEASTTAAMTMHMDMAGQALHSEGEVDYTSSPPQMAMSIESPALPDQSIEMRLVDQVLYMNMGQMTNGKFVSYDLSDAKNLPPGMDQLTGQMDPLAAFASFEDGLRSVVFAGDEEVDGEQLGHYEMKVDTSEIEQLKDLPTQAELPKTVDYDVWLDDEFRIRKMVMDMDVSGSPIEVEVEFFDWDEPVDIAAPPASEIVEQPQG